METRDIASTDVVTVYVDDSLLDVAKILQTEGVGSAVVLDVHDDPLGIVTDRDLVVYGQHFVDAFAETAVNEVLSMTSCTVDSETDLADLTATMREEGVRRVPVVDSGVLTGIVTLDDVLVHLSEELDSPKLDDLAAVVRKESPSLE